MPPSVGRGCIGCFNPRSYTRGDTGVGFRQARPVTFQSTPLREGRPVVLSMKISGSPSFQSTPQQEGRLDERQTDNIPLVVSIHAPTRGATHRRMRCTCTIASFNPRPYMRDDKAVWFAVPIITQFQSTPLRERRRSWLFLSVRYCFLFQSKPLREGDTQWYASHNVPTWFQSTPLQ